jgi:NAD(P)-dependent dehydrogenase (short-subunit alcohol dehydrogenase family)
MPNAEADHREIGSLMRGKTVVITGSTSGIGEIAAETLAKMGARIVLVARDKSRAERTLSRLRSLASPSPAHSVCFADLTRLDEMKRVAGEVANQERAKWESGLRRLIEGGVSRRVLSLPEPPERSDTPCREIPLSSPSVSLR